MKKNNSIKRLVLSCVLILSVECTFPARAALVWWADFGSYSVGSDVTLDASGNADTFTSFTGSSSLLSPEFKAVDGSSNGLTSGLSGKFTSSTATTTAKQIWVNQADLGSYSAGSVFVLGFDMVRPGTTPFSNVLVAPAASDGVRATAGFLSLLDNAFSGSTKKGRVTLVANLTGGNITLPGTLGTLADGMVAAYGKDVASGEYVGYVTTELTSSSVAGFIIDQPINAVTGAGMYHLYDNFGVWDSVTDKVNNVNVLELDFGTLPAKRAGLSLVVISTAQ